MKLPYPLMKKAILLGIILIFACDELIKSELFRGCTLASACNYVPGATEDDGSCLEFDCDGECGGDNSTCGDYNAINTYELEDLNANSSTFGQTLNHSAFLGKAILYYFSSLETWTLCKSRFDSLNELFLEYGGINSNIIVIGVGKNDGDSTYTVAEDTILPYIKETDDYNLRNELDVVDRDVFFYDSLGEYVHRVNLTDEFDKDIIESIINGIFRWNILAYISVVLILWWPIWLLVNKKFKLSYAIL